MRIPRTNGNGFWRGMACLIVLITLWDAAQAQTAAQTGKFEERIYQDAHGSHKYAVFIPANFRADRKSPVILFLHGAGERGSDGYKQLTVGLAPYVKAQAATFPFVVVFPQAEDVEHRMLTGWQAGTADAQRAVKILDAVQDEYHTDPARTVLVGWSMGGYGAWSLGAAHAGRWSAVVPISGGADLETVSKLKNTPVWAFHGAKDKLVPATESRQAVEALKAAGGNVHYTEFPDVGHAPFEETFGNPGLIRWMLDPKTAPATLVRQPAGAKPIVPAPTFVPAVEIPAAVGIRLGNEALHDLSYAAPQLVPANMLTGTLGDMFDSTSAAGRSFSVRFSGLSYRGSLDRVSIKALANNQVLVQLGLRNISMTIGATYISGARHSAQTGPIQIGIGYQYPVWLNLNLTPYIADRTLKLRLNGAGFHIPPDNFYVTQPAGVWTRGFGMTEARVTDSLMSGLYGSRGRIENEVRNIAPRIAQELEQQLNVAVDAGPLLAGMWPLPVYQPALKAWPQAVAADENGVTLQMGLTAAQPDPFAPKRPFRTADSAGVSLASLNGSKSLKVALAPEVLTPLTQMLVHEDLGIINVLDIPEKSFARLADKSVLQSMIPDLNRYGDQLETRAVLRMAAPLETGEGTDDLQFHLPKVLVAVSINTNADDPQWKQVAQFDLNIQQEVQPTLEKPSFSRREVQLDWENGATVTGTSQFAEGYEPEDKTIDTDKFIELFRDSWSNWTEHGSPAESSIPDLALGNVKLKLDSLNWQAPVIIAGFQPAGVKISNLTEVPFTYETKGPHSGWSTPYTLKPGDSAVFDIPFPLTYRRNTGTRLQVYTLLPGSHSEFRNPVAGGPPQLFQAKNP